MEILRWTFLASGLFLWGTCPFLFAVTGHTWMHPKAVVVCGCCCVLAVLFVFIVCATSNLQTWETGSCSHQRAFLQRQHPSAYLHSLPLCLWCSPLYNPSTFIPTFVHPPSFILIASPYFPSSVSSPSCPSWPPMRKILAVPDPPRAKPEPGSICHPLSHSIPPSPHLTLSHLLLPPPRSAFSSAHRGQDRCTSQYAEMERTHTYDLLPQHK